MCVCIYKCMCMSASHAVGRPDQTIKPQGLEMVQTAS